MIPEGELKCIWMDAGIVDFKLCDLQFQCESCPFDALIRQQLHSGAMERQQLSDFHRMPESAPESFNDAFERQLAALLAPFTESPLPRDRTYTQNHLWFKQDDARSVTVGLDHLALHLLGPVNGIVYPSVPTNVQARSPCVWIVHRHGTIALKTPIAGTIVQTNALLKDAASILFTAPYDDGWILRLSPNADEHLHQKLLSAEKATAAFQKQAEAFGDECRYALAKKHPSVGTTLYDGGQLVDHVEDILGSSGYFQIVVRKILLQ